MNIKSESSIPGTHDHIKKPLKRDPSGATIDASLDCLEYLQFDYATDAPTVKLSEWFSDTTMQDSPIQTKHADTRE